MQFTVVNLLELLILQRGLLSGACSLSIRVGYSTTQMGSGRVVRRHVQGVLENGEKHFRKDSWTGELVY